MKIIILVFACLTLVGAQEKPKQPSSSTAAVQHWDRESMGKAMGQPTHYSMTDHLVTLAERVRALETKIADLEKQLKAANELADSMKEGRPFLTMPADRSAYTIMTPRLPDSDWLCEPGRITSRTDIYCVDGKAWSIYESRSDRR